MGGGNVKRTNLKTFEIQDFQSMSSFPNDIVKDLHCLFNSYCNLVKDDGILDYQEFLLMMNKSDCIITQQIFKGLDNNKDNQINFREFLKFISCFVNGTNNEKINLTFKIFANEETKLIEKNKMIEILKSSLQLNKLLDDYLDEKIIEEIVKITFDKFDLCSNEVNGINLDEYKKFVEKNPGILNWFKIDLQKIRSTMKDKINNTGCFG
jgi:Ca2+-binding EF-hand superfamily protein